jgi:hypothetical protein
VSLYWCRISPEKQNRTRKGFAVAEIIEIADKFEVTSNMLAASEVTVSGSRRGLFSAFAGDQECWVGQEIETGPEYVH